MHTLQQIKTFINSDIRLPENVRLEQILDNGDFIKVVFNNRKDDRFYRAVKIYQKEEGLTVNISNVYDHTDMYDFKKWLVLSPHCLLTWLDCFLPDIFPITSNEQP